MEAQRLQLGRWVLMVTDILTKTRVEVFILQVPVFVPEAAAVIGQLPSLATDELEGTI